MDGAEEERGEFGPGLGDQRDAVAGLDPGGDQAIGGETRVVAQLAVAVGAHEAPARIVEIEPAAALRRIVERLADGGEVGEAARLRAEGGGGGKDDLVRCDIVFFGHRGCNVPESGGRGNKHVIFRVHDCARRSLASGTNRPFSDPDGPIWRRWSFSIGPDCGINLAYDPSPRSIRPAETTLC